MPPTSDESDFRPSATRSFIHSICDDYERDRQQDAAVTMAPYLARTPEPLKDWILKELIAIEVEILQSTDKSIDLGALRESSGVSADKFDAAWQKLQESALHMQEGEETKDFDEGNISTVSIRRGAQVVSDSMEMSIYRTQSEPAIPAEHVPRNQFLLVADDYELIDLLGEGGMGAVYRAFQHSLQRQVALKIIPRRFVNSPQALARFYNEAEATASMKHPGIVRVFEFDERHDVHYYTMELVEGGSLGKYVRSRNRPRPPRIEPNRAAEIMAKVCDAAHYAHTRPKPVIHRDIKPANILLDDSGNPLLTDFGLAKVMDNEEESLTMTGTALGTAAYMAPEQASGSKSELSPRADVYALGATLYALLAGRQPFEADSVNQIMRDVINTPPPPLTRLEPSLPRELEIICEKCLAKRPEQRYETASDLADDIRRYLEGQAISTRPLNAFQRSWRWCQRNPLAAGLMASILVGFIASMVLGVRAMQQAERANASLNRMQQLLDKTVGMIAAPEIAEDLTMQPLRNAILENTEDEFENLVKELEGDASVLEQYANAQVTRGKILSSMSRAKDARVAFESARKSLDEVGASESDDVEEIILLASTHVELAKLSQREWIRKSGILEETDRASVTQWKDHALEAAKLRERAVGLEPNAIEYQRLWANAREGFALAVADESKSLKSEAGLLEALDVQDEVQLLREEITKAAASNTDCQVDLARGFGNVARMHLDMADYYKEPAEPEKRRHSLVEAELASSKAIAIHSSIGQSMRAHISARRHLAECYRINGEALQELNEYEEAESSYKEAVREIAAIADKSPHVYFYQSEWADAQVKLIDFYLHALDEKPDPIVVSHKSKALDQLHEFRRILIKALRTWPKNREAADFLFQITLKEIKKHGPPKSELETKRLASVLQELAQDMQQLVDSSSFQEYDWLEQRIEKIRGFLQ